MIVGPAMPMARMLSTRGAAANGQLLVKDHLLHEGGAAAAVLLRPRDPPKPASYIFRCQSRSTPYASGGHVGAPAELGQSLLGQVLPEPVPYLVSEGLLFRGQREIHEPSCQAADAAACDVSGVERGKTGKLNDRSAA